VTPDILFLGQKDYQQFVLMQRMIADLRLPVDLRMGPTLREPDGLAMSSRNRYLDAASVSKRRLSTRPLKKVRGSCSPARGDFAQLTAAARTALEHAGFSSRLRQIRRRGLGRSEAAARGGVDRARRGALGRTRLIDNLLFD